jgi:type III secretory pathway component EscV
MYMFTKIITHVYINIYIYTTAQAAEDTAGDGLSIDAFLKAGTLDASAACHCRHPLQQHEEICQNSLNNTKKFVKVKSKQHMLLAN